MILQFTIPVKPVAKQSFRAVAVRKGRITGFTPASITKNKTAIQKYIKTQLPPGFQPFRNRARILNVEFVFKASRAKDYGNYKTTKPDLDNLMKQLLDSIKGVLIEDDNIICEFMQVGKYWLDENRISIQIEGE